MNSSSIEQVSDPIRPQLHIRINPQTTTKIVTPSQSYNLHQRAHLSWCFNTKGPQHRKTTEVFLSCCCTVSSGTVEASQQGASFWPSASWVFLCPATDVDTFFRSRVLPSCGQLRAMTVVSIALGEPSWSETHRDLGSACL